MDIIELKNVSYSYPDGTKAIDKIDYSVKEGSITAILGPNGAGKSTLLMHHNGTLKPESGSILLKGVPFTYDKKGLKYIRSNVGMVFQNPDDQLFAPTVRQDVAFGPKNLKITDTEIKKRVDEALRLVKMEDHANKPPHFLSAGQKKRVAIAGVIAMRPGILVLDEPTAGLDPQGSSDIIEILDELNSSGSTIVFSTHDVDLAARWADSIYVLHEGKIRDHGSPNKIFADHAMIRGTGLRLPAIVQTFRELKVRGVSGGDPPLNMLNFIETVSKPFDVLKIRCAVASKDVHAGEKVGLVMKNGMMHAVSIDDPGMEVTASGNIIYDARSGEDVVVGNVSGTLSQKTGKINIVPVPRIIEGGSRAVNIEILQKTVEIHRPDRIGAMGSSAKVVVRKIGTHCDFDVDVVQSSILASMRGLDVMVFATGGMVERVIRKVEERNMAGDRKIKYQILTVS